MSLSAKFRTPAWRTYLVPISILVLVLFINIVVRVRLLDAPLERDEGDHAHMAQTMLAGYAPWQLAYNMKLPGTDTMYAVSMAIFGQTAVAVRLGLILVNGGTILLVALLGRRLFGLAGGAMAGASYGILSFSQGVFGTIAHATHYVVFFAVLATLLLLRAGVAARWLFLSGLVYGLAFLMKQPGICFGAFGALYWIWRCRRIHAPFSVGVRGFAAFCGGLALPYALVCLALWRAGVFGRFWYWTVTLARAYATQSSPSLRFQYFEFNISEVVGPNLFLWIMAGLGLAVACWNRATRRAGLFTAVFLLFSFLAVAAGGAFYPHYFILMLPALALANGAWSVAAEPAARITTTNTPGESPEAVNVAAGNTASSGRNPIDLTLNGVAGRLLIAGFALACLYSVFDQRAYLFRMTPYEFSRSTYGLNPFPEAIKVADYIRSHSAAGSRVAVLGSESEIYFYSQRQAATGYPFTYGLMETHRYASQDQVEMIREIESARPEYMVFVAVATSWMRQARSDPTIFHWIRNYTRQYYAVAGIVDLVEGEPATYRWGPAAVAGGPASPVYMVVYHRL